MANITGWIRYQRRDRLARQIISTYKHHSGLKIDVLPRLGFHQNYAFLVLPFGSINSSFVSGNGESIKQNLGTMNLLADIIFNSIDDDSIASQLTKIGVSSDLKVSHDSVVFEISTADYLQEAIKIIISGLINLEITEAKIIASKNRVLNYLSSLERDSEFYMRRTLRQCVFSKSEYYNSPEGTRESVSNISLEDLQICYDNIFNISNVFLELLGDINDEEIVESLSTVLQSSKLKQHNKYLDLVEDYSNFGVVKREAEIIWQNPSPGFALAYNFDAKNNAQRLIGKENVQLYYEAKILLEMCIGASSDAFDEFLQSGLLGEALYYDFNISREYALIEIYGKSLNPEATVKLISQKLETFISDKDSFSNDIFESRWKAIFGQFVQNLDSLHLAGEQASRARLNYIEFADYSTIFNEIRLESDKILDKFSFVKEDNRAIVISSSIAN